VKCEIESKEAPNVHGYYLGQTQAEIPERSNNGLSPTNKPKSATHMVLVEGDHDRTTATAQNSARSIQWIFDEDKIGMIILNYYGYSPTEISQFVRDYSKAANLPAGIFKVESKTDAVAQCKGFNISIALSRRSGKITTLPSVAFRTGTTAGLSRFDILNEAAKRNQNDLRNNPRKNVDPHPSPIGRP
jgi:hypothetical protein